MEVVNTKSADYRFEFELRECEQRGYLTFLKLNSHLAPAPAHDSLSTHEEAEYCLFLRVRGLRVCITTSKICPAAKIEDFVRGEFPG